MQIASFKEIGSDISSKLYPANLHEMLKPG